PHFLSGTSSSNRKRQDQRIGRRLITSRGSRTVYRRVRYSDLDRVEAVATPQPWLEYAQVQNHYYPLILAIACPRQLPGAWSASDRFVYRPRYPVADAPRSKPVFLFSSNPWRSPPHDSRELRRRKSLPLFSRLRCLW